MKKHIDEVRKEASKGVVCAPRKMITTNVDADESEPAFVSWRIPLTINDVEVGEVHGWTAEGGWDRVNNKDEVEANAALIAHCLNTHQMLLDALKECAEWYKLGGFMPPEQCVLDVIEAGSFVEVSE